MNKRLEMLEKLTKSDTADSFAWYGLGMEYRKLGRAEDALGAFETLRQRDPEYLAVYLMAGQLLGELGRAADAAGWLRQGIVLARKQGNQKALSELEDALGGIE